MKIDHPQKSVIAPGRVNLLGEHVDYNGGIVLPAAIDRYVRLNFRQLDEPLININAHDLGQQVSIPIDQLEAKLDIQGNPLFAYAFYPAGVAWALQQAGLEVRGIDAEYSSNIPIGSGLSSSAAVEVAFATAWQALGGWKIERMALAQLCQKAENLFIGVQSGLMDQFASVFGEDGHVLSLDTRSQNWKVFPLPQQIALVIADSQVPRSLAGSAYNERRADCEQALQILQVQLPDINYLCDISPSQFYELAHLLPNRLQKRARFVVEECERVRMAVSYLQDGNIFAFGELMAECHRGLRDLYEVSCPELEALVEISSGLPGCIGARLTGAGFGGCTVNLVDEMQVDAFIAGLQEQYHARTGKTTSVYRCRAAGGAALVEQFL